MPFTKCLGCDDQKRSKSEKFYFFDTLIVINTLRSGGNAKNRKLKELDSVPPKSQLCKSCFILRNKVVLPDSTPDLTIYRKGLNCHTRCTFACKTIDILVSVPQQTRRELLMNYKFFIQPNARMCINHIGVNDYWSLVKQISKEVPQDEQKMLSDLLFECCESLRNIKNQAILNIDDMDSIDDNTFQDWIGYNKEQFQKVCSFVETCKPADVAVLLCKFRTALGNAHLSFLFKISERTVANYIRYAREDMLKTLVPKFINNNDRSVFLSHIIPISKTLLDIPDDKGCVVFDATYRLAQKSKNFAGQKQLWSEQKKMPLTKPMVGCTSDGYVLFALGPYNATHNDATILKDCFERYEKTMDILYEGDTIVVDRGFRDVIEYLKEEKKFKTCSPGLGQLDTIDANASRFVTKIRWIIEQVFGRLKKKFKLFALPAHNATLSYDYELLLIAFALLNLFHVPILSDKQQENISILMKSRLNVPNRLKEVAQKFNLSQVRTPFLKIEYSGLDNEENNRLLQFPVQTMDDLYSLSFGKYQIRNAISYFTEHQRDGTFLVQKFQPSQRYKTAAINFADYGITVQNPLLVKAYMKSRYRGGKHHHIFVLADKAKIGRDAIEEYFCTCECGSRTVGCCSHIMTIVWYLGYGQYHQLILPNPKLCDISIDIKKKTSA